MSRIYVDVAVCAIFAAMGILVSDVCAASGTQSATTVLLEERPEWLLTCRRSDPNINECVRNLFQHMFPALAIGIPEIDVDRFEPLYIKKLGLTKGEGPVTISGTFNDILAHGPSNATTKYAKFSLQNNTFELGIDIPEIRVEGNYDLSGNILILPLVGSGRATLLLRNVSTSIKCDVEFPKVNGREIMNMRTMKVDFLVRGMRVHLENLFNGNKILGQTLNTFVNQNSQEILRELREPIGEALSEVFRGIMNNAYKHIPTDLWLLD